MDKVELILTDFDPSDKDQPFMVYGCYLDGDELIATLLDKVWSTLRTKRGDCFKLTLELVEETVVENDHAE